MKRKRLKLVWQIIANDNIRNLRNPPNVKPIRCVKFDPSSISFANLR